MQIGLDSFSLHPCNASPMALMEYLTAHGFDGIQFGDVTGLLPEGDRHRVGADLLAHLSRVRANRSAHLGPARDVLDYAKAHHLYTHVSVGVCNPHGANQEPEQLLQTLTAKVELAAELGWHELHGVLGGPKERYELPVAWPQQLADSTAVLQSLAPVLRDCTSRINLETHGDVTTFELLRMIEAVGDDALGVCLDTANVVLHGEHPVAAARRVAPVTHLLHCKDVVLSFADEGLRRQTLPPGRGLIDWPALVGELVRHDPDIPLTIEDHKWIFDAAIYSPQWRESQCDVARDEVLDVVAMAWEGERRIREGLLPAPEEAEKVPYGEQMEERLKSGLEHFRRLFP